MASSDRLIAAFSGTINALDHHLSSLALNWLINIGFGVLALMATVVVLRLVDRFLLPDINLVEEIQKGNIAAAISFSAMLIFAAVIIGAALK